MMIMVVMKIMMMGVMLMMMAVMMMIMMMMMIIMMKLMMIMMMMVMMMMLLVMIMIIIMMMGWLAHGWRPPRGCERAQRDNCPKADSKLFRRYSELRQTLMTCGKLSNHTPSMKSRLMAHATALPRCCWG